MVALRGYQEKAVEAVRAEWSNGNRATLLVLATGTGKTVIFSDIARRTAEKGNGVLVLAHRGELIDQAAEKLEAACGGTVAVEKAESHWYDEDPDSALCVASVQTLQGGRLDAFPLGDYRVLIVDEAHHAVSESYRRIIDRHMENGGFLLGVTATADRADKRGLAEVFDSIAFEYPLARAVADGYLAPIRAKCLPLSIDISSVKVSHGDYQANELGSALDPYLPEIAKQMAVECAGRKTVCFLPLVATAERMAEELNAAGLRAVAASGYDSAKDRADKKDAFERGDYDVLCNSMLYTEGWDCPEVDCIVVLRPTKSRSLYAQMVGRGTRLADGKDHLLLLDFLWMCEKHDLARPASLLGKEPKVAQKMTEKLEEGGEWELEELADTAEKDVIAEREAALAAELEKMRRRKKKFVDPLQFATSIQDLDLVDYVPTFIWECKEPTDKQRAAIEKFGVDASGIESAGQASALLDALCKRADSHLATPKQIRCLEKYGFKHVGTWAFEDASKMISRIAAVDWKLWRLNVDPATYDPRRVVA
jgi:superfamily II DNA or RNA helicase